MLQILSYMYLPLVQNNEIEHKKVTKSSFFRTVSMGTLSPNAVRSTYYSKQHLIQNNTIWS